MKWHPGTRFCSPVRYVYRHSHFLLHHCPSLLLGLLAYSPVPSHLPPSEGSREVFLKHKANPVPPLFRTSPWNDRKPRPLKAAFKSHHSLAFVPSYMPAVSLPRGQSWHSNPDSLTLDLSALYLGFLWQTQVQKGEATCPG